MGILGKFKIGLLAAVALLGVMACSYDDRKIVFHPNQGKQDVIPGLDFEAVKVQVFDDGSPQRNYCARCHGWVSDHAAVVSKLANIRRLVDSGEMPRGQTLPAEKKALLFAWIDSGAPLTAPPPEGGGGQEPLPTDPTPPSPPDENNGNDRGDGDDDTGEALNFATMQAKLFDPMCSRCHAWTKDYRSVSKSIEDITFQIDMGFMPKEGSLTEEQKTLLSDWIEAGLPE